MKNLTRVFRQKDEKNEENSDPRLLVRPMAGNDHWNMMMMISDGESVGNTIGALSADEESYRPNSLVAIAPGGRMVGFILGQERANQICVSHLIVTEAQEDAQGCIDQLVRAMARHCVGTGQKSLGLMVSENDLVMPGVCLKHKACKERTFINIDEADPESHMIFYRIHDLPDKFGMGADRKNNPEGPGI